jgi:hypothetical protein
MLPGFSGPLGHVSAGRAAGGNALLWLPLALATVLYGYSELRRTTLSPLRASSSRIIWTRPAPNASSCSSAPS